MTPVQKNRATLILLFSLFFLPAIIAWYLNQFTHWQPKGMTNHGQLIQPPVNISSFEFSEYFNHRANGYWNIVVLADDECSEDCVDWVLQMHQARLALDKDVGRVKRWLWSPEEVNPKAKEHQVDELLNFSLSRDQFSTVVSAMGWQPADLPKVFLVDPFGFAMMYYDKPDATSVLRDLERLLKIANEDVETFRRLESESEE